MCNCVILFYKFCVYTLSTLFVFLGLLLWTKKKKANFIYITFCRCYFLSPAKYFVTFNQQNLYHEVVLRLFFVQNFIAVIWKSSKLKHWPKHLDIMIQQQSSKLLFTRKIMLEIQFGKLPFPFMIKPNPSRTINTNAPGWRSIKKRKTGIAVNFLRSVLRRLIFFDWQAV